MNTAEHVVCGFAPFVFFLGVLASAGQGLAPSPSASYEGQRVVSVVIAGRPDLDLEALRPLIAQPVDAPYSSEKVNQTVKDLKSAGIFQGVDVQVTRDVNGLRLMFVLQPALYFGVFEFSNANKSFTYSRLLQIATYPKQQPYDSNRVAECQSNLVEFFHQNGYFLAEVKPEVRPDAARGIVDVLFHIDLKQHARIGRVVVAGASTEETERLSRNLRSIRARLRGVYLRTGSRYSLERMQKATSFLQQQLARRRYLASTVQLASSEYDPATNRADIKFNVVQGQEVLINVIGARISARAQRSQIPIHEEHAIDPDLVQEGEQNLASYFQRRGFFDVEVNSRIETKSNYTKVIYEVQRGQRGRVSSINVTGNRQFSRRELDKRIKVRPERRLYFWSRGHFSRALLNQSITNIESLYRAAGYGDVKVVPNLTEEAGKLHVLFEVGEGERDIVRTLTFIGNTSVSDSELLAEGLNLAVGKPYSRDGLRKDRDQILATYLKRGFLVAKFNTETRHDAGDSHHIDVIYQIVEGPQMLTNTVTPLGTFRTDHGLIGQTANINVGQPLSTSSLLAGQSKLYSLGVFDWVSIDTRLPAGQSPADVLIKLHEGNRNRITYSVGFEVFDRSGHIPGGKVAVPGLPTLELPSKFQTSEETIVGPTGSIQYTRSNLARRADSLSIGGYGSRLDAQGSATWSIPSFRNTSWTANLSISEEWNSQNPLFTARSTAGFIQFRRLIGFRKEKTLALGYVYSRTALTNLLIPDLVPPQDRNVHLSGVSTAFARDERDNPIDAHSGSYQSIEIDLYPEALGSNTSFTRFLGQAAYYHRVIGNNITWANSLRLGLEFAFSGTQVPLNQQFFSGGGSTLRGFPLDSAGPQRAVPVCSNPADPATCTQINVPAGGPQLFILNSELRFPVGILSKLRAAVFYDGGNVFPSVGLQHFFSLYSNSVGGGIRYSTPVGPIRFDVARNLNPVAGVNATQFFVTLGEAF